MINIQTNENKKNCLLIFKSLSKIIFVFFLFLTGCVSWRDNRVNPIDNFPSKHLNSTIQLDLKASLKANGLNVVPSDNFSAENTEKFLKIARNKNIFKEISSENKNMDYILKINYEVEINGFSGLAFITLGLIPGFDRCEQTMNVEFIQAKNLKLLDKFTITEKSENLYQILLLFAVPFSETTREVYESSYNDIVENVLDKVYLDISKNR